MYSQIAANKRKTFYIISLFLLIIAGMGFVYAKFFGSMTSFYVILVIALVYSVISYFASSRLALTINGARQISKRDAPEYYSVVENLCIATGMPMPKVYIIDDPAPNAMATGRNPNSASVAATTGLLEIMTKTELEGVMAHEMGHVKNYDIRVMMVVFACVSVIGLLADSLMRLMWFGGRGDRRNDSPIFLIVAIVLAIASPIVASMVQLAVSRRREFLADATGAQTTRYPDGLASALLKIEKYGSGLKRQNSSTAHLFFANPLKKSNFAKFFSTHPPVEERVKALEKMNQGL